MLTVSKALLGASGTAVGDCVVMALFFDVTVLTCGVTVLTCGVTAPTCGVTVQTCGVTASTCGVTVQTCGVTASTCGVTASTSLLNLEKVSTSIVGRSKKVADKLSDKNGAILSGTVNCKKMSKK